MGSNRKSALKRGTLVDSEI